MYLDEIVLRDRVHKVEPHDLVQRCRVAADGVDVAHPVERAVARYRGAKRRRQQFIVVIGRERIVQRKRRARVTLVLT